MLKCWKYQNDFDSEDSLQSQKKGTMGISNMHEIILYVYYVEKYLAGQSQISKSMSKEFLITLLDLD